MFELEHPTELEFRHARQNVLNQRTRQGYIGVTLHELESLYLLLTNLVRLKGNFVWDNVREIITETHCEYYPELAVDLRELLDFHLKPLIEAVEFEMGKFRIENKLPPNHLDHLLGKLHIILPTLYAEANIFSVKHLHAMKKLNENSSYSSNNIIGTGNVIQLGSGNTAHVQFNSETLFKEMRKVIESQVEAGTKQTELLAAVQAMESSKGQSGFLGAYQNFMTAAANHVTVFAPFLPALTKLLS